MRHVFVGASVLIALVSAWLWHNESRDHSRVGHTARHPAAAVYTREQWVEYFRHSTQSDLYSKVHSDGQQVLVGLVDYFCREQFEGPSCVQYAIVCGRPCLSALNGEQRGRVLTAYQDERRKANLPPLTAQTSQK